MTLAPDLDQHRPAAPGAPGLAALPAWVRTPALRPRLLAGLRFSATLAAVQDLESAEEAVLPARLAAVDALHAAVPLADADLRRSLLKLKRAVHNDRPLPAVALPERVRTAVERYTRAVARREAARADVATAERDDTLRAAQTLADLLADPAVDRGLAVTAPGFHATVTATSRLAERLADPRTAVARSATSFVSRAALKPSPASTLTTVAPAAETVDGEASRPRADVRVAPAVTYRLLEGLASDPDFADLVEAAPPSLDEEGRTLLADRVDIAGYLFRHDELSATTAVPYLPTVLATGRATVAAHAAALAAAGQGGDDPLAAVHRLLRSGALHVVLPWDRHTERHAALAALHRRAAASHPGRAAEVVGRAAVLERMDALSRALATAPDHAAAPLAAGLRAACEQLLPADGRQPVSSAAVLHESVRTRGSASAPVLPGDEAAAVRVAARLHRPRLVRSLTHQAMAQHVAATYGEGARVRLDRLLSMVGTGETAQVRLLSWARRDLRGPDPGDDPAPLGAGHVAPSLTVHLQRSGDLTVLNAALPGAAAAAVRYLPLLGARERAPIERWLRGLAPGGRWLAVGTAEEWSDLQGAPQLEHPRLDWPADPPRRGRPAGVALASLWAVHDPATGTLRVEDADGPVALLPVGVISPYLVTGPLRLLLTLADPWILRPATRRPDWGAGERLAGADRVTEGGLVVARRTWWVEAASFPRREPDEALTAYLRRVDRWRSERELPDEVFVQADSGTVQLDPRRRKPQWLRWDAPHPLEVAARVAERADRLVLTEALPDSTAAAFAAESIHLLSWHEGTEAP